MYSTLNKKTTVLVDTFENIADLVGVRKTIQGKDVGMNINFEANNCKKSAEQLRAGIFKILVMGSYNAGKSTLINALLETTVLPESIRPCTSVLTFVQYGEQEECEIHYKQKQDTEGKVLPEQVDNIGLRQFFETYRYTDQDDKEYKQTGIVKRFAEVNYAVIKVNNPLLNNGIRMIDSPGLNNNEIDDTLSIETAKNANAILYVCPADSQYNMQSRKYFDENFKGCNNVFFIVNKFDLCRNDNDKTAVKSKIENDIQPYFTDENGKVNTELMNRRIFYVSSLYALYGYGAIKTKNNDFGEQVELTEAERQRYYKQSGFEEFKAEFEKFVSTDDRLKAEYQSLFKQLSSTYKSIEKKISEDNAIYEKNSLSSAQEREKYKKLVEEISIKIDSIEKTIDYGIISIQQKFAEILRNSVDGIDRTWDADILEIAEKVDFSFGKFLRLGLNNVNILKSKEDRDAKMEEALRPFSDAVAEHFVMKLQYNLNNQTDVLRETLEQVGQEINIQSNEIVGLLDLLSNGLRSDITDDITNNMHNDNVNFAQQLISLVLGDFSQMVTGSVQNYSWMEYIKRTVFNTIWQTLASFVVAGVLGLPALPVIIAVEMWQMKKGKDKFVSKILSTMKESVMSSLRENMESIIIVKNDKIREIMQNIKHQTCYVYEQQLEDVQTHLNEVQANMADMSFDYNKEKQRCEAIREETFNLIQVAYNEIFSKDLTKDGLMKI